jgi:hypothetical protein
VGGRRVDRRDRFGFPRLPSARQVPDTPTHLFNAIGSVIGFNKKQQVRSLAERRSTGLFLISTCRIKNE